MDSSCEQFDQRKIFCLKSYTEVILKRKYSYRIKELFKGKVSHTKLNLTKSQKVVDIKCEKVTGKSKCFIYI